ncbi:MAG: autotransporter outer membrane beta-barrel domain-containing protein [Nitrosomonadales bacterium]|nr:autotransporter outer membrane beta-barrel domain-containing protein [Nitrosomonadales bacterium]
MNTGAIESKASHLALTSKFLVSVLTLGVGLMPQQASAAAGNAQFYQYVFDICNTAPTVVTDLTKYNNVCAAFAGYATSGSVNSVNVGTANAGSGTSLHKKKRIGENLDEQKEKPAKGASADGGGWGFLITPQYSKNKRIETDLENGYQSELAGLVVGLDYRVSDSLVLGGTLGQTRDKANFLNDAGWLKTSNNTFTLYGTWLPSDSIAVDGYLGYGKLNFDNQRQVAFSFISGITSGSTTGNQVMAGVSASYQTDIGRVNLSPFINLDYIKTSIKGYSEIGSNPDADSIALHYGDRSTISLTSSLGVRLATSHDYDWGTLAPSVRLAAVHEFQNKAKQINNEFVITPGTGFLVATDAPDRNYLNLGIGVTAALNGGALLFLDFDKRTQDKLLSSWAVSLGGLFEF